MVAGFFLKGTPRCGKQFCFVASIPGISSISMGHSWLLRAPGDNVHLFYFFGRIHFCAWCRLCGALCCNSRRVLCFKHFNLRGKGGRPPLLPGGGCVLRGAALRPGARVAWLPPLAWVALLLPGLPKLHLLTLILLFLSSPTILQIPHAGVTTTKQAPNPYHN